MRVNTVLLASLLAGTTLGRIHGHHRRHAQLHEERDAELEERQVGALVVATIDGQTVTWTNAWSGQATAAPPPPPPPPPAPPAPPAPAPATDSTTSVAPAVNTVPAPTSAPASPPPTNVNAIFDATLNKISNAFGGVTAPIGVPGSLGYVGNVGDPYDSNIIQVAENTVSNFEYTLKISGENLAEPWIVNFWNKIGPDGGMNGWYGGSALAFTIGPGDIKYVAIDANSQGAFGAAPGGDLPVDGNGGWASTWGEWDFGNSGNNGWSGFDVSCIQAQAAGLTVQGMQMCAAGVCSSVTNGAAQIDNAYYQNAVQDAQGGIGGNLPPGPVQITVVLDYA